MIHISFSKYWTTTIAYWLTLVYVQAKCFSHLFCAGFLKFYASDIFSCKDKGGFYYSVKFWFLLRYLRRTSETLDAQCVHTEALRSSYSLIVNVHVHEQIRVWVVIKLCGRRRTWQVHVLHAGIIRTSCKQGSALIERYACAVWLQPPHAYE